MFKYSERPGTLASRMMPDNVPEEVKIERLNRMIALQNELSLESNRRDIGKTFEVLVEGRDEDGWYGRSIREAPESDGCIHLVTERELIPGSYIQARITGADAYDLTAEVL